MTQAVRVAGRAVGRVTYEVTEREKKSLAFRRSIFFARDLKAGEVVDETAVKIVRPAHGLAPDHWNEVLGRKLSRDVVFGTPVTWGDLI
jgi:sialic acid synthase SpsE